MSKPYVTKVTGEKELFDADKLCRSLVRSGAPQEMANHICQAIEEDLTPEMTTQQIWRKALRFLVKSDLDDVSARYSLRRAMANLGPDGYVFEKYIAVVLEAYGYEAKTNQVVAGASGVEHEIDVLATKDGNTYYIEAKYKNEYGLKTHVDTVMYSWARYIDIAEARKNHERSQIWLVTNTEFTISAKQFGKYREMVLVGWDYPVNQALEDMIADKKLYPVSILPSVSQNDRKALIKNGLILAQDLIPYTADNLENKFGLSPKRSQKIIDEARALTVIE